MKAIIQKSFIDEYGFYYLLGDYVTFTAFFSIYRKAKIINIEDNGFLYEYYGTFVFVEFKDITEIYKS